MCGACGRTSATDAWSGVFLTRRARWEAARIINDALSETGHPARVTCAAAAWVVHSGTGRSVLVDTASGIWQVLLSLPGLRLDVAAALSGQPPTPVLAAVVASAETAT
ncbi:hypothetical protein [Streptomyces xinghaiensis]|uniref:hypothetical protein n=1 Tax=Streptomyces xinghaiensis TaxID=1038928 RepID=UPI000594A6DA|nr:hypothetical protein [Streptomyces xinghaiensis]MZE77574.1 hypothetical protein [Streptomyces sp. SID5475]